MKAHDALGPAHIAAESINNLGTPAQEVLEEIRRLDPELAEQAAQVMVLLDDEAWSPPESETGTGCVQ